MSANELNTADWNQYLAREEQLFSTVHKQVIAHNKTPGYNRYSSQSPINAENFSDNWNRSHLLMPDGKPIGVVILLHGLSDSPYSLSHLAQELRQKGYVAVVPRLPGHGTVPASLTKVNWQQWAGATRLAVKTGVKLAPDTPLILVGYSNGGALAMNYTFEAMREALPVPRQIILLSPMIGVSGFARYAGIAGLPSLLPAFARSAWLNTGPEINPYKYNSFPVKAARQSWLLTQVVQKELRKPDSKRLPPILSFQSIADATVSTRSVINDLYNRLPNNGSELVLFDINQSNKWQQLIRENLRSAHDTLLPKAPRNYCTKLITNISPTTNDVEIRTVAATRTNEWVTEPGLHFPDDMFSLSHIAMPFPQGDALYGSRPAEGKKLGINMATLVPRGERNVLIDSLDSLMRQSYNPFYPWMVQQINQFMAQDLPARERCRREPPE